jgi:hypothetical protein
LIIVPTCSLFQAVAAEIPSNCKQEASTIQLQMSSVTSNDRLPSSIATEARPKRKVAYQGRGHKRGDLAARVGVPHIDTTSSTARHGQHKGTPNPKKNTKSSTATTATATTTTTTGSNNNTGKKGKTESKRATKSSNGPRRGTATAMGHTRPAKVVPHLPSSADGRVIRMNATLRTLLEDVKEERTFGYWVCTFHYSSMHPSLPSQPSIHSSMAIPSFLHLLLHCWMIYSDVQKDIHGRVRILW